MGDLLTHSTPGAQGTSPKQQPTDIPRSTKRQPAQSSSKILRPRAAAQSSSPQSSSPEHKAPAQSSSPEQQPIEQPTEEPTAGNSKP